MTNLENKRKKYLEAKEVLNKEILIAFRECEDEASIKRYRDLCEEKTELDKNYLNSMPPSPDKSLGYSVFNEWNKMMGFSR